MVSLAEIWQAVLATDELGDFQQITVTTQAAGENALRTIISTDIATADTSFDETHYNLWFVYVPTTGEQRRVLQGSTGYTPASGTLLLNVALAAALPVGTVVWLIRRLGVKRHQALAGLRDAANNALKDLSIEAYIEIDGDPLVVADDNTVDLSSYADWLTQNRILGLRRTTTADEVPAMVPGMPRLRRSFDTLVLEPQITLSDGDTAYLDVGWPSDRWIKVRRRATGTVTLNAGAVQSIAVNDPGEGYASSQNGASITIYGGSGSGATATMAVSGGVVTGFTVTAAGSGYTSTPGVICPAPTGGSFAESSVGLVNDDDECVPVLDYMVAATLYHIFVGLTKGPGQDTSVWELKAQAQLGVATDAKLRHEPIRERADDLLLEDTDGSLNEDMYGWPD